MITFYFIRHAESKMNTTPHIIGGRSNYTPLTSLGYQQAEACGLALQKLHVTPDVVYSSPAVRTQQTAATVLDIAQYHIKPTIAPELQELYQGRWEGKLRARFYTPATLIKVATQGKRFAAPDGESMQEVGERMFTWLMQAARTAHQQHHATILVFSHGMAIKCLAGHISNWSHTKIYTTAIPNVSLSTFCVQDTTPTVKKVGEVII